MASTKRTHTLTYTNNKKQYTGTSLIPDINDIKNQFLDPITYLKLISVNPEEFNPRLISTIINNFESQFPLSLFINTLYNDIRVDPILINSLILRGISTRFLTENQVINKDDIQVDLDNILEEARDMLLDDPYSVLSNNMNNDLYDKLMSFSNDDLVEVCKEAFELLKKDNSHVYDTTPMNMYSEELIPYFQKIMDDEEMMEV
jgi:hypothetical protein